ncbi:MAG: RNA 2',3'-cyclic phosphodiesterase [Anaerolineales bacterium]|jgi:2'-5' RNA ligase
MRTFVAIPLPDLIHRKLADLIGQLKEATPGGSVRWVRAGGIHLTLKFLGELGQREVGEVSRLLKEVVPQVAPFVMDVTGLGCFPNLRRPRVIWVGIEESTGRLSKLQSRLEAGFDELGFEPEGRRFHPHLTLGRVRRGATPRDLQALRALLESETLRRLGEASVDQVCLFRSELRPTGAVYTRLTTARLGEHA